MPGFDNGVMFANNVDFTGSAVSSGSAQVTTNGQLLIGSTASPNIRVGTLTSTGGTLTITNGAGTINLETAAGGVGLLHLTGNSGGSLNPDGANNINTLGTGSITVAGAGSTLTTQLTGLTNHAVLIGAGTATITSLGPIAATGAVLQSNGAGSDPGFSTATYPSIATGTGKILIADGTNWVASTPTYPNSATGTGTLLRADGTNWVATTSTYPNTNAVSTLLYASATNVMSALATANNGTLVTGNTGIPSILAGPGTTGNVLQSNAAAAPSFSTATYPSIATGTGTILRADGTNWVATTATYPATTTANQILYSSATNVVGQITTANNAILVTDGSGVPSLTTSTFVGSTAFTPAISFGGGTTGITYTTQVGYYTRIGNVVFIHISILLSSKGSSSGAALITGLPFTVKNQAGYIPVFSGVFGAFTGLTTVLPATSYNSLALYGLLNTTTLQFAASGPTNAAISGYGDGNFTNTSQVVVSGFYDV